MSSVMRQRLNASPALSPGTGAPGDLLEGMMSRTIYWLLGVNGFILSLLHDRPDRLVAAQLNPSNTD